MIFDDVLGNSTRNPARSFIQCDAFRRKQFENCQFSRGYNFLINDLILILKTPSRPYSFLAKVSVCLQLA